MYDITVNFPLSCVSFSSHRMALWKSWTVRSTSLSWLKESTLPRRRSRTFTSGVKLWLRLLCMETAYRWDRTSCCSVCVSVITMDVYLLQRCTQRYTSICDRRFLAVFMRCMEYWSLLWWWENVRNTRCKLTSVVVSNWVFLNCPSPSGQPGGHHCSWHRLPAWLGQ